MKAALVVWGIVFLVVFSGAQWLFATKTLAESWIWVVLAVIIVVMNFLVGRTFKKMPKEHESMWMFLSAFGFVATLVAALGIVPVPLWWALSLWLLLMGAAIAVGGHATGKPLDLFIGIVLLFSSTAVGSFGTSYFLAGALFMGLLGVLHGYFIEE